MALPPPHDPKMVLPAAYIDLHSDTSSGYHDPKDLYVLRQGDACACAEKPQHNAHEFVLTALGRVLLTLNKLPDQEPMNANRDNAVRALG